jgi:YidC/Oxa1 family membrane protein insertase
MENQRLFLWLALAFVAWLTWQAWVEDYHRPARPPVADTVSDDSSPGPQPATDDLPDVGGVNDAVPIVDDGPRDTPSPGIVTIRTDVLDLQLSLTGGDLVSARLPQYPVQKNRPDLPVQLLDPGVNNFFVYRSGLRATKGAAEPNHQVIYSAPATAFVLEQGEDVLEVPLTWVSEDGLRATKILRFERGSYAVRLRYEVDNQSGAEWRGASYVQIRRRHLPLERSMVDVDTYSYRGPIIYDGEKYEKLDLDDLVTEPVRQTLVGGWLASIQHHFLAAAIPPADSPATYTATYRDGIYTLTAVGAVTPVAPGATQVFETTLFVGPKLQEQLAATADGLKLTVDYGFLTVISQPLFWVLEKLHGLTGNWGWAIILLTVLIKLVFYKLSETSGKSMAKMRKLQPRLKALQERYADDRQALSQAMMEMYKREKVNPASGCLPILVQMPVFLALYWVLLESVEMRQAPFMLWIDDLSSRDPYFILPLLMGITMFLQQRLNPAPPDPVQAKVMMALPVVFTVFFAFFPAGLVLYWFVNNLLSIAQQWRINTVVERSG